MREAMAGVGGLLGEFRARLTEHAEMLERWAQPTPLATSSGEDVVPSPDVLAHYAKEAAIHRAALSALEDAERWRAVRDNVWEIHVEDSMGEGRVRVRGWDDDGVPYTVAESSEGYDDAIDSALYTARGADEMVPADKVIAEVRDDA